MLQFSMLFLSLLVMLLETSSSALDLDAVADSDCYLPSLLSVPLDEPAEHHHHLSKRQSIPCLFFFLVEPPRSTQCVPLQNRLPLTCTFLVGNIRTRQTLDIGWFFSLDGDVADLVQVSRFQATNTLIAFQNSLVVRKIIFVFSSRYAVLMLATYVL